MLVYYRSSSFLFLLFCIFYNIIQGYAQYITKDGLARIKSVLCLLEIVSFRILIHIVSYFVDAGQGAGRPARAPKAEPSRRGRVAAAKDEDPGLVLISRRPPQQKFTNFEEYMSAHGGATAPIEDHSEKV